MGIKVADNIYFPENGIDIYLVMDYSFAECKDFSIVYFGKKLNKKNSDLEKGVDICNTYKSTVNMILTALNLKDNLLSVTIWGGDEYVITNLTNDRSELGSCINFEDFYFRGYSNGRICAARASSFLDYNPYKEIYHNAIENRKVYPKRKAVGIVITQRNVHEYEYKEKESIFKAVEQCAQDNIEIVTIGLKNTDMGYNPIDVNEIKKLSTNKELSIVCSYNEMKKYLAKIAEKIGGAIDYHYETVYNKNEEYEKCTKEHFGLRWIFIIGLLGLLCFFVQDIEEWVSKLGRLGLKSLPDNKIVWIFIVLFVIVCILLFLVFCFLVYIIKEDNNFFIACFFSLFIIGIGMQIVGFILGVVGIGIWYIHIYFGNQVHIFGIITLAITIILIVKKIIYALMLHLKARKMIRKRKK